MAASEVYSSLSPTRRGLLACVVGITIIAVIGVAVRACFSDQPLPPGVPLKDYQEAAAKYRSIYGRQPGRADILSMAGELAVRDERLPIAAACFNAISTLDPRYGLAARFQQGQVELRLDKADEAERNLTEFLALADRNPSIPAEQIVSARKFLNYILSVELRFEDRKVELAKAHAANLADVNDSKQFFFPNLLIWNSPAGRQRLSRFVREDADNRRLKVISGRYLTVEGQLDQSRDALQSLYDPEDLSSVAALLECHFERNDWEAFARVVHNVPSYSNDESWLLTRLRGEWALHEHLWMDALEQFERLQKVDPANPWAMMGLARASGELNRQDAREEMLRRSLVLSRIRVSLSTINEQDADAARKLGDECRSIGLNDAAETFMWHATRIESTGARHAQSSAVE